MATRTQTLGKVRERAVELGVYLPLGAYARVRDEVEDLSAPNFQKLYQDLISRGETRVEPLERIVRRRARKAERDVKSVATQATRQAKSTARKTTRKATAASAAVAPKLPRVAAPRKASDLPIKSYASLTASEIVAELKGLTQTELAKVYKFEKAHENRSTILESIEGKLVNLPLPTYDAMTVDEINGKLDNLNESQLKTIRRYESETKDRTTIIERIDSLV